MSKSIKDQTTKAFQVGGYAAPTPVNPQTGVYQMPGTGITGYQQYQGSQTGYNPYGGATPFFQPVQFSGPQYTTAVQTTNLPTFGQTVGQRPGQYDEFKTYVNDSGQTLQIPFKDGKPIYPIPEGYKLQGEQTAPTQPDQTTVTPTLGQTQVRDEGGRDEDTTVSFGGTTYADKGAATKAGADIYGATGVRGADIGMLGTFLAGVASGLPGLALNVAGKTAFGTDQPGSLGYLGGDPATKGTGNLDYETLSQTLNMSPVERMQGSGVALSDSQIKARMDVFENLGVNVTGYTGYEVGDAVPGMPGAIMGSDGIARNPDGSVARVNGVPTYASFSAFFDRVTMSQEEKDAADKAATTRGEEDMTAAEIAAEQAKIDAMIAEAQQRAADKRAAEEAAAIAKAEAEAKAQQASETGYKAGSQYSDGRDSGSIGGVGMGGAEDVGFGSGTDCLTENMKVKLNGVIDFVTNIKVGDMIDGSIVKEVLHKHMRSGYFVINNELEITNDHPVLANGTWTKPEELYIGDYINDVKVESIKYIDRMTPTVSIVIDGDSFDVYTEGNTYTVHGRYREVRQQAA